MTTPAEAALPEALRDLVDDPPGDLISESGRNERHAALCRVVNFLLGNGLDTDWLVDTAFSDGAADGKHRTLNSVKNATDTFDPDLWGSVKVDLAVHDRLLGLITGSDSRSKVMRAIVEEGIRLITYQPAVSSHCEAIKGVSQRHVNTVMRDFEVTLAGGLFTKVTPAARAGAARIWHLNPSWDGATLAPYKACLECARRRKRCTHQEGGKSSHISPRKRYENKPRQGSEVREWIKAQSPETRFTTKLLQARLGISRQSAGKYLRQVIGEGHINTRRRSDKLGELSRGERYWFNN